MAKANVNDRRSLARVYPPDAFARDAARNGPAGQIVRGVRVASAPDEAGEFDLEPANRQVGEAAGTVFLAPRRQPEELVEHGRDGAAEPAAAPDPEAGYQSFLDDIITAAKIFGFDRHDSPGAGDPRLRGLRQ